VSLNNSRLSKHSSFSQPQTNAAQGLTLLQNDLLSTTWIWAVDEVSSTIAHQINEPLTALLLYLHEIKESSARSSDIEPDQKSAPDIVDRALYETERLCKIMERLSNGFDVTLEANVAFADRRASIVNRYGSGQGKRMSNYLLSANPCRQQLLTKREQEVLGLITKGATSKEGGRELGISCRTFEVHRAHIMAKLGARNTAELVRLALGES